MHEEWSKPDAGVQVRQSDLLISRNPITGTIADMSLVITADCDICNRKFGMLLLCLSVIPFKSYIRTTYAASELKSCIAKETTQICEQINKWHRKVVADARLISEESAMRWVLREEPKDISSTLNVPDSDADRFMSNIANYRTALLAMKAKTASDPLDQFIAFQSAITKRTETECLSSIFSKIQKNRLPEDCFLFTNLPDIDNCPALVLLRNVVGVSVDKICYRSSEAISDEYYLRVGRLTSTFKYAVSQAFGTLYSRIGLPREYEDRRKDLLTNLDQLDWRTA